MPAVIPFIPLIAAGVAGGATVYGAHEASSANKRASDVTAQNDAAQIAYEKQHDADLAKQEQAKQDFAKAQWDAQQKLLADREARLAPYRAASAAALGSLGDMLGISIGGPSGAAPSAPSAPAAMPSGWTPESSFAATTPAPRRPYNPTSVLPGGMIDPWSVAQPTLSGGTLGDQLHWQAPKPTPNLAFQY